MSTLVVRNLPEPLHEQLRERARANRRSLTKEVVVLIEQGLQAAPARAAIKLPAPIKLRQGPVTTAWIEQAIAQGRA